MDVRIRKVLNYLEGHLALKLSLEELASIACMSEGHFHKTFKKETQRTPFQFIEEIKMNKAFKVLISGSKKVHELALDLGYNDYETFSRSFKKHHSLAPDDLKAIAQKVQTELKMDSNDLIIKTYEVENLDEVEKLMDQLAHKLKRILSEFELTEMELKNSIIMSVIPKSINTTKESNLIKNKFKITEHPKIWEEILKLSTNGNS